jgi:hypothetical protein
MEEQAIVYGSTPEKLRLEWPLHLQVTMNRSMNNY